MQAYIPMFSSEFNNIVNLDILIRVVDNHTKLIIKIKIQVIIMKRETKLGRKHSTKENA